MRAFLSSALLVCIFGIALAKKGKNQQKVFHLAKSDSECGTVEKSAWSSGVPADFCKVLDEEVCFCVSKTAGESWHYKCGQCKFRLEVEDAAERRAGKQNRKNKGGRAFKNAKQLKKQQKQQRRLQKELKQQRKAERIQRRQERRKNGNNRRQDDDNQITVDDELALE